MVIYADILILVNTVIDYFLLRASMRLLKLNCRLLRIIAAAFTGGISSLYIFISENIILLDVFYKLAVCFILSAVCFGIKGIKPFLKNSFVFFGVTCLFAGAMWAVFSLFSPKGMAVRGAVVYFNISPVVLIVSSAAGYLLITLFEKIFSCKFLNAKSVEITLEADGNSVSTSALCDSGNSLTDIMGLSVIIIVDKSVADSLFKTEVSMHRLKSRYRAIPAGTVSGSQILDGYRCDRAVIKQSEKSTVLTKPVLAISKTPISDHGAIINPDILL